MEKRTSSTCPQRTSGRRLLQPWQGSEHALPSSRVRSRCSSSLNSEQWPLVRQEKNIPAARQLDHIAGSETSVRYVVISANNLSAADQRRAPSAVIACT